MCRRPPRPLLFAAASHTSSTNALVSARTVLATLVAGDLFFYQAIRQVTALLMVPMAVELAYTAKEKGWLLAAPSVGAIVTQLAGGLITSLIGARWTTAISLLGMASMVLLLPLACTQSITAGIALLCVNGLFYGPMFPTNSILLSNWMLPAERGWAAAQSELAISVASFTAPFLVGFMEPLLGWRSCFHAVGVACLGFAACWVGLVADTPAENWFIRKDELALLTNQRSDYAFTKAAGSTGGESVAPWRVLVHPASLVLFLVHGVYNLGTLSINSWMPTYYSDVLGLKPDAAKVHLMMPHIVAMCAKLVVPAIAAALRARGVSMLSRRRAMCAAGFGGTALALLLVCQTSSMPAWASTASFSLALAFTGLHAEGFRANYLDVTRAHVGIVSGLGNCISSVAAMVAPLIVSALVQRHGSWQPVWLGIAAFSAATALAFARFSTATPIEETIAKENKAN